MDIELVSATPRDEPVLARLMQLYAYDFSEFMGWEVAEDALFHKGDAVASCWSEPWRHAFLLRVDGHVGGLAILDERSRLTGTADVMDVAEFFVLRKHRRHGVGSACATRAFDLYPRKWEVRQTAENVAATAFWRRAIGAYTGGRFEETVWDDERWRGPVQSFDASGRRC